MILVHFFVVFIFAEAGLFAKIAKICTQWKFPAIQYSNSPAPRNPLEIHSGHLGITKCRERARHLVWWPGMGRELEDLIRKCPVCCKYQLQHAEPLCPSCFPDYPWQRVGADLFQWKQATYLLVIDYFSRYIKIAKISGATAIAVISQINVMGSHKSSSLTMDHSSHQGSWLNLQKLRLHPLHKQPQVPSSKWWGRMSSEKSEEHTENIPWSHGIPSYTFGKRIQSCRTVNRMQASYNHPSYIWTVEAKIAWLFSTSWKGGEYESPTKKQFWPASSG